MNDKQHALAIAFLDQRRGERTIEKAVATIERLKPTLSAADLDEVAKYVNDVERAVKETHGK